MTLGSPGPSPLGGGIKAGDVSVGREPGVITGPIGTGTYPGGGSGADPGEINRVLGLRGQGIVRALTGDLQAGRQAGTIELNWASITGNPTNGLGYMSWVFDRPTALIPIDVPTGFFRYRPIKPPATVWGNDADLFTLRSSAAGICYFHSAGTWWLKYLGTGLIRFLLVPCEDPGELSKLLSTPGSHTATAPASGQVTAIANTSALISAANINRKAITIQNNSASPAIVRIGLGSAPVTGVPPAGTGLALQPFGSITLSGDTNYLGAIYGISTLGWTVDFVEVQ